MKNKIYILLITLLIIATVLISCGNSSQKAEKYETATRYMRQGKYEEAIALFDELGGYSDASACATYCEAITYCEIGDYQSAYEELSTIPNYEKTNQLLKNIYYETRLFEGLNEFRKMLKNPNSISITDYHISFPENYATNPESFASPEKPAFTLKVSGQNGFGGYATTYVTLSEEDSGKYGVLDYATTLDSNEAEDLVDLLHIVGILTRYQETDMSDYINEERVSNIIRNNKYTNIKKISGLQYSDFAK